MRSPRMRPRRPKGGVIGGLLKLIGLATVILVALIILAARSARHHDPIPPNAPIPVVPAAPGPVATPAAGTVRVNEVGWLGYPDGQKGAVWVALQESAWDEMLDAQNARSLAAMAKLAEAGKVKAYPVGTKVKVIHSGLLSRKVIILDGLNGRDAGDMGWVQMELIRPEPPALATEAGGPKKGAEPAPDVAGPTSTSEDRIREERQRLIDRRKAKRAAHSKRPL